MGAINTSLVIALCLVSPLDEKTTKKIDTSQCSRTSSAGLSQTHAKITIMQPGEMKLFIVPDQDSIVLNFNLESTSESILRKYPINVREADPGKYAIQFNPPSERIDSTMQYRQALPQSIPMNGYELDESNPNTILKRHSTEKGKKYYHSIPKKRYNN